ncbi:MAG: hypothetical protein EON56_01010, partial [Alphaproteobacteria bacterium]
MLTYIIQRLGMMLLTLWAIITLTFFLMHAVPGGPFVSERMLAPEIAAALNAKYGLDQPVWQQYFNYLSGIATFDLFGRRLELKTFSVSGPSVYKRALTVLNGQSQVRVIQLIDLFDEDSVYSIVVQVDVG